MVSSWAWITFEHDRVVRSQTRRVLSELPVTSVFPFGVTETCEPFYWDWKSYSRQNWKLSPTCCVYCSNFLFVSSQNVHSISTLSPVLLQMTRSDENTFPDSHLIRIRQTDRAWKDLWLVCLCCGSFDCQQNTAREKRSWICKFFVEAPLDIQKLSKLGDVPETFLTIGLEVFRSSRFACWPNFCHPLSAQCLNLHNFPRNIFSPWDFCCVRTKKELMYAVKFMKCLVTILNRDRRFRSIFDSTVKLGTTAWVSKMRKFPGKCRRVKHRWSSSWNLFGGTYQILNIFQARRQHISSMTNLGLPERKAFLACKHKLVWVLSFPMTLSVARFPHCPLRYYLVGSDFWDKWQVSEKCFQKGNNKMDRFVSFSLLFPTLFALLLSCYKRELIHLVHHHLNMGNDCKCNFWWFNPYYRPYVWFCRFSLSVSAAKLKR